jgi:hypothetical protein
MGVQIKIKFILRKCQSDSKVNGYSILQNCIGRVTAIFLDEIIVSH